MKQEAFIILRNMDTTEGRGPMLPVQDAAFQSELEAFRYIGSQVWPYKENSPAVAALSLESRGVGMCKECWYKVVAIPVFKYAEDASEEKVNVEVQKLIGAIPQHLRARVANKLLKG
jgi:hypothetical protein